MCAQTALRIPNTTQTELLSELSALALDSNVLVRKALDQAFRSHHAQKRDDGASYLEQHVYPVTLSVIAYYRTIQKPVAPELVAGALLHDSLEDDEEMTDERFREEFGERVFSIVKPLSKPDYREYSGVTKRDKKHALNRDYFAELERSPEESRIIKLADRLNNILCIHLSPKPGKMEFYIEETEVFYLPFAKKVSEYYHSKIKGRIAGLRAKLANPSRRAGALTLTLPGEDDIVEGGMEKPKIREVVLRDEKDEKNIIYLGAKIDDDGSLVLEGHDLGEVVESFWGDSDYEYWLWVDKDHKDEVLRSLIEERFSSDSDFRKWLKKKGIPCDFDGRSYKDTVLLWLIKDCFDSGLFRNDSEFKDWLGKKGIPSKFDSWV